MDYQDIHETAISGHIPFSDKPKCWQFSFFEPGSLGQEFFWCLNGHDTHAKQVYHILSQGYDTKLGFTWVGNRETCWIPPGPRDPSKTTMAKVRENLPLSADVVWPQWAVWDLEEVNRGWTASVIFSLCILNSHNGGDRFIFSWLQPKKALKMEDLHHLHPGTASSMMGCCKKIAQFVGKNGHLQGSNCWFPQKKTYHLWQEIIIALNNHLLGRFWSYPMVIQLSGIPLRCCFCFFHIPILPYPWVDNSSRCQSFLSCQIDGFIKNNFELASSYYMKIPIADGCH